MALSDLLVKVGIDSSGFRSGISDLRSQSASLRSSMAQMAGTIRDQVKELNAMARAGKTGTDEFKKLQSQIKQNESAFKGMGKEAKYLDQQLKQMGGPRGGGFDMSQFGSALTGGLIGGGVAGVVTASIGKMQQVFSETIQVTIDFDRAIRKVAATSGATSEQMDALSDAAIEMGSKTKFTASQAAEGLNYMALAGWNTEQAIAGLPGVLNLAAAATMELGTASDILTDTMAAFGLEAKDSTAVADVFAQVQSKANTTVEMLGEAMKYAAPQFASAGQTIETTATIIGLLANQGIKASMAGTAMNAMLKDLKKGAEGGVLEFGKMNIALYDQQGNMRNMIDIIREMRVGVQGLTQQQRDAITGGLFEERSIKAVNILLNSTGEVINGLENDILSATGRSKEMADLMQGGLSGSVEKMKSAWEGFQLTVAGDGGFAKVWYDGWAAIFAAWTDEAKMVQQMMITLGRAKEIGFFDALEEERQLLAINDFSKDYKSALEGFPMSKLTDQMTRLTWLAEGQADAFKRRNQEAGKRLAPVPGTEAGMDINKMTPKDIKERIKALQEEQESLVVGGEVYNSIQLKIEAYQKKLQGATSSTRGMAAAAKTASDIFSSLQVDLAKSADFYRIMDDEVGALADQHSLLEGAIKKAWSAGGSEAEQVIRNIKAQLADMTAARLVPEVKGLPMRGPSQVVSTTATGLQLPKIDTTAQADLDAETESLDRQRVAVEALQGAYTSLGQSLGASMEALAAGTGTAADALRGLGYSALESAQKFIQAEIAKAIAAQISSNSKLGAIGIGLAGVAIAGIFGLMRGALSQSKSVKLAEGGIVSGRTMAEVGEYPGAAFNPEVVAPLDKLQAMLDIGGTTQVSGTFRVQGADLVLVLDNAQRKMNKFRV